MESVHEKIHQIFYDIDKRDERCSKWLVTLFTEEFMTSINSFYDEFSELRFEIPKISHFPSKK